MIIKKSSLCWLLDNKIHRVSNDRFRHFLNVTEQNPPVKLSKRSIRSKQQYNLEQKKVKNKKT